MPRTSLLMGDIRPSADMLETMKLRRLRFSLRTLLLAVLLAGCGMLIWQRREPWVLKRTLETGSFSIFSNDSSRLYFDHNGLFALDLGSTGEISKISDDV